MGEGGLRTTDPPPASPPSSKILRGDIWPEVDSDPPVDIREMALKESSGLRN